MIEEIKNLKKIELHIHLDGSLEPSTLEKLTGKDFNMIRENVVAKDKCLNLSEYLTKFDLSISQMQTKDNLIFIAKNLADYFESQNVVYAEVRFAPMFHTKSGLSYDDIIESIITGFKNNNKVKINLILCMMRGFSEEDNLKTIDAARRWLNKGVVALDLAGAEDKYPLSDYAKLFDVANNYNIPFIIHAGENGSYEDVMLAVNYGAKRIGHGIHIIENEEALTKIKDTDVLLEICPTSNVQTNSVSNYSEHPIKDLYKRNIPICINTDNKTVSNISLNDEYIKLYNTFKFSLEDFKIMNLNALKYSFLSDEDKKIIASLLQ